MAKRGIRVSRSTVGRWVDEYGRIIEDLWRGMTLPVGYTWHVDEVRFRCMGQSMWLFGVMDAQTRIIISYEISPDKISYNATGLFGDAVAAAGRHPDTLVTDGLHGFGAWYARAMYTAAKPRTVHVSGVGIVPAKKNGKSRDGSKSIDHPAAPRPPSQRRYW